MSTAVPALPICPKCQSECVRSLANPLRASCARTLHYFAVYERGAWHEEPSTDPAK